MLRRILTKVSSGVVYKRKLPDRVGGQYFYVSPSAILGYLKANIESVAGLKEVFTAVDLFVEPGNIVWDIGANVGAFSFAAAWKAGSSGSVLAVEPDVFLANILYKTIELGNKNGRADVEVLSAAVSGSNDIIGLNISGKGRAANYIETACGSRQVGTVIRKNWVVQVMMDDLMHKFGMPDFIKIDVEGAELGVIKGGMEVLSKARPIIMCEVTESGPEIAEVLSGYNYVYFNLDHLSEGRRDLPVFNTLAVPIEKADMISAKCLTN